MENFFFCTLFVTFVESIKVHKNIATIEFNVKLHKASLELHIFFETFEAIIMIISMITQF